MSRSILRLVPAVLLIALLPARSAFGQCLDYRDAEGSVDTPGTAWSVAVAGSYAYIADGSSGLQVIDVSHIGSPAIVGSVDTPGAGLDVCVSGSHAYIADGSSGIQVIDVSNPMSPTIVGSVPATYYANEVALYGTYLCVVDWSGDLLVIDVSTPTAPAVVGTVAIPSDAEGIDVAGSYAYLATPVGLRVISLSTPTSPVQVGSASVGDYLLSVKVDGSYAYVGDAIYSVYVVDVSNPAAPHVVGYQETPEVPGALGLVVTGNRVYTGSGSRITALDVTDPTAPVFRWNRTQPASPLDLVASGSSIFVAMSSAGLYIWDASALVGALSLIDGYAGDARDVAVSGSYAYAAAGGLSTIEITDPTAPIYHGSVTGTGGANGVVVAGSQAYVASGANGLRVIDISVPDMPAVLGTADTPGTAYKVRVAGSHAYVADGASGVQVVDVANPMSPGIVGAVDTPGSARNLALSGSMAYVADYDAGLQVVDISNPLSPAIVGDVDTPGFAGAVYLSGNFAYVYDDTAGIQVVDISVPSSPSIVGNLHLPGPALEGSIAGATSYVACYQAGVCAVDIFNPTAPALLGRVRTFGNARAAVHAGSHVFVPEGLQYGLEIFRSHCGGPITGVDDPRPPSPEPFAHLLPGFPNPFRVRTALTLDLPARSRVSLTVLDVRGRRVRSLMRNRVLPEGETRTSWDGTNDAGIPAAAGVYFIRLSREGENAVQEVTLLR